MSREVFTASDGDFSRSTGLERSQRAAHCAKSRRPELRRAAGSSRLGCCIRRAASEKA